MDEFTKKWHFYSWIERREEKANFMKDLGCFIGSFYNPEMARKIKDMENNKSYDAGEDGFDMATKFVAESMENRKNLKSNKKRKRKKISIR